MWKLNLAACIIAAGVAVSYDAAARQARPATDNELRSAYCLVMLQGRLEAIEQLSQIFTDVPAAAESLAGDARSTQHDIARLRAYLLPRVADIDALSLLGAARVAEAERAQNARDAQALSQNVQTLDDLNAALEAAPGPSRQTQQCQSLDWLPF